MKNILWLSNVDLLDKNPNHSGTWIHSMFHALSQSSEIKVCANITFTTSSKFICKEEEGVYHHYVPRKESTQKNYPTKSAVNYVVDAILNVNPDLIHVWGMELYWGLIMGDKRLQDIKKLLEIQGIKSIYSENQYFMGGLSYKDIKKMRSFVQRFLPLRRIESIQSSFHDWGVAEKLMLKYIPNINTQSEWVRNVMPTLADSNALIMFNTGIILRDSFTKSTPWYQVYNCKGGPVLFTTTSPIPYKGLHVTIKAFKILKATHPDAILKIAGMDAWKPNLIRGGYNKYIYSLIKELKIENSVIFLGNLNETEMQKQMYHSNVFILSSFIETYCLALAEALAIGLPCVAAYSTALPELIEDGENGLLYPVGDYYMCASKICSILNNFDFAKTLSEKASNGYRKTKSAELAISLQVQTYLTILSGDNNKRIK